MKGLIMWEQKSGQDCCLCFWRQSASLASFRPARQGPYNRIRNRQERFVSQFLPVFYCSRLACCFAFHAAYSRCPCPSAPCRARRTLTGMILQQMACRRKSSRPFCVTWFVSLFFTHLLLTLLPGSCIDLHEVMWSRKFSIRQNMEIYRYLWRYFVARDAGNKVSP